MNIASSIINQDNSGIASMDTDQIMDLFSLGEDESDKKRQTGKITTKQALSGLDELWDESQYDDMQNDFFNGLNKHISK
jgi:TATA-binding protein-associated factor